MTWLSKVMLFVLAVCLGSVAVHARSVQEERALSNLNTATDWLIEQGIPYYEQNGSDAMFDYLAENGPVLQWADPQVNSNGIAALFRIHFAGYYFNIESLYQSELDGILYDYWIVNAFAADWASPYEKCEFLVTSRPLGAKRSILRRSPTFFDRFETDTGQVFELPTKDAHILYRMRAWETPSCFPGLPLPEKKICLTGEGEYFECR
jgi:hypothetical protein